MKKDIHFYSTIIVRLLFFMIVFVQMLNAQDNPIKFSLGEYNFKAMFDTSSFISAFTVNKKGDNIYSAIFNGRITEIKADNLNKDGQTDIFIDNFSGGAHCCLTLYVGYIMNGSFVMSDSLFLINSNYEIKDLNDDNMREITAFNDTFAYAFTNYAQSRFSPIVYTVENNKFVDVTRNFPYIINASITELKSELKAYTNPGFKCPDFDTSETFNTDAGAVKALLAPIVTDYYNLGEVQKGYDFVDSVYKCPDTDKFISDLTKRLQAKIIINGYSIKNFKI